MSKKKYWNRCYIPAYLCAYSFVSYVIICNWNLRHNMRQTGDMHRCMDGRLAKGQLLPKMGPMCWLGYYLTLLQRNIISKDLDSSHEPNQWSPRRSIDEARIRIILRLQHQPCGEMDMILRPCRLRAFKSIVNYQTN